VPAALSGGNVNQDASFAPPTTTNNPLANNERPKTTQPALSINDGRPSLSRQRAAAIDVPQDGTRTDT
jgi:hypothetical protein